MYSQYIKEYETAIGLIKFEYTFKQLTDGAQELDNLYIVVNGKSIDYPKSWEKQTSTTIIRKICAMLK